MTANPPLMNAMAASALARIPSPMIDPTFDDQMADHAERRTLATSSLRQVARLLLLAHEGGQIDDAALAAINTGRAGITHACDLAGILLADLTRNAAERAATLVSEAGLDATDEGAVVRVAFDDDDDALAVSNEETVRGVSIAALTDVIAAPDTDADLVATASLRASLALAGLGPMVDCVTDARMDDGMGQMGMLYEDFSHWFEVIEEWLMGDRPDDAAQAWAELCAHDGCDTDYAEATQDFETLWAQITTPSPAAERFHRVLENHETTAAWLAASADALDARNLEPGVARYLRGLLTLNGALSGLRETACPMKWTVREGPLFMFGVIADELDLGYAEEQHNMAMQAGGDMLVLLDLSASNTTLAGVEHALTLCYAQVLAFEAMANHGFTPDATPENTDAQ
jgi:hypothetical protein